MSSKTKILSVAHERFYRNGYLSTSVDDIIQEAGVSKSNFYYHYKSKEDLGIAVLDQRKIEFQASVEQTLGDSALSAKERLTRFLQFLVLAQDEHLGRCGCPFGNLVAEMAEHSERFRCQLSAMFDNLNAQIACLLDEGQRNGEFRSDVVPVDMAGLILQTTQGMMLMTKCHRTVDALERTVNLLLRLSMPSS